MKIKHCSKRLAKLGSGARFASLKEKLAKKGAKKPGALAAWIGRKKFGAKKMASLSAHGKKSRKFSSSQFEKTKKRVFGLVDAKKEDMGKC